MTTEPAADEPDMLTPYQASVLLGVHPSTLRRYTNRGMLPVTKLPSGHRRFARADLLVLLNKSKDA
jgi:excisionase family DNA binding protein